MKITPLEIRQKEFEKKLRGYDKDEVAGFLLSMSNEWERMLDENKELTIKLEQAQKEVEKLREVESSLFKTLKTAEDTGANLVEQANKAAELHLRETQIHAEALLNESKSKAKSVIEKAEEEANQIIVEVQDGVKELERNYAQIENSRQHAMNELRNLAEDLIKRVEKSDASKSDFNIRDQIKRVRELAHNFGKKIDEESLEIKPRHIEPISVEKIQREMTAAGAPIHPVPKPKQPMQEKHKPPASEIPETKAEPKKSTHAPPPSTNIEKTRRREEGPVSFFDLLDEDE